MRMHALTWLLIFFLSTLPSIASSQNTELSNETEIVGLRTQNQKVFPLGNGQYQYLISSGPLHYQTPAKEWEEIDTTITSTESGYEMAKSIYQAYFRPVFAPDDIVYLTKEGRGLRVRPGELYWIDGLATSSIARPQTVFGQVAGNELTYPEAYGPGIDFRYLVNDTSLNKLIVVDKPEALMGLANTNEQTKLGLDLYFELDEDLIVTQTDSGIYFQKAGRTLWRFNPPRAWDSAPGERANEIVGELSLVKEGQSLLVRIAFPATWLRTAQYPVTLDPDTYYGQTTDGQISGQSSSYATARTTSTSFGASGSYIIVGQEEYDFSYYEVYRGYLEFDTSGIDDSHSVDQALLYLTSNGWSIQNGNFDVLINKYNWTSPISSGNREANYDGALSGVYDNLWRNTSGLVSNTSYSSSNLDTSWISKTGLTRYALLTSRDAQAVPPNQSSNDYIHIVTREHATQAYRPYLSLTVTAPPPNTTPTLSSLGPTTLVDGSTTNDATPTFTFTTADGEDNTVAYELQVSTDADFSTLAYHATSTYATPGAISTTTASLPDASYYWRVLVGDGNATSTYTTANNGEIAFILDTYVPPTPTITTTTISGSRPSRRVNTLASSSITPEQRIIEIQTKLQAILKQLIALLEERQGREFVCPANPVAKTIC